MVPIEVRLDDDSIARLAHAIAGALNTDPGAASYFINVQRETQQARHDAIVNRVLRTNEVI